MHLNRSVLSALSILVAATAVGCKDQGPRWEVEVVESVAVVGIPRNMLVGQTLQFEGRALTNLGRRADEAVIWSVSNPDVISVTSEILTIDGNLVNRATVTGLSVGAADLIATADGKTGQVRVTVNPPLL